MTLFELLYLKILILEIVMHNTQFIRNYILVKGILIAIISSSFISPTLANQQYKYGFSWGGMYGACSAYKYNRMSKRDAKHMVKLFLQVGEQDLDRYLLTKLKNLQYKEPFIDGCEELIAD